MIVVNIKFIVYCYVLYMIVLCLLKIWLTLFQVFNNYVCCVLLSKTKTNAFSYIFLQKIKMLTLNKRKDYIRFGITRMHVLHQKSSMNLMGISCWFECILFHTGWSLKNVIRFFITWYKQNEVVLNMVNL